MLWRNRQCGWLAVGVPGPHPLREGHLPHRLLSAPGMPAACAHEAEGRMVSVLSVPSEPLPSVDSAGASWRPCLPAGKP